MIIYLDFKTKTIIRGKKKSKLRMSIRPSPMYTPKHQIWCFGGKNFSNQDTKFGVIFLCGPLRKTFSHQIWCSTISSHSNRVWHAPHPAPTTIRPCARLCRLFR